MSNRLNLTPEEKHERERIQRLEATRRWILKHPDKVAVARPRKLAKQREWYAKNRDHALSVVHDYYTKNREGKIKTYREKHKEEFRVKRSAYFKTDKGRSIARNHQHKRRVASNSSDIDHKWLLELKSSSKVCPMCSAVMVDDGRKENGKTYDHVVPIKIGGLHVKSNVRVVCRKCNLSRPRDGSDLA
jgi:hypothetical protein